LDNVRLAEQTDEEIPDYALTVNHWLPARGVDVLPDTFSRPPSVITPYLEWGYRLPPRGAGCATTFVAQLPAMQPGEVRKVSEATSVTYQLRSGNNTLTLPPLYVTAGHIIALSAASAPASPGSSVVYEIDLFNPGNTADTYTLEVPGIPADWVTLPPVVAMAAGEHKTIELIITIPADADVSSYPFAVVATTGSGGSDQAMETLDLVPAAFELSITPDLIRAAPGELLPYTLTLSNPAAIDHTFALSVTGLPADLLVSLPASVEVSSSSSISVSLLITATTGGFVPFQVTATRQSNPPRAAVVPAAFSVEGKTDLALTLDPPAASAGPGTPARFTLTVNNTGNLSDTFDLTVQLPGDDWSYELLANDTPQSSLSLIPLVFNNASLHLHVTPPPGTPAGNYPITVVGTSRLVPGTHATIQGEVHVLPQGVTVEILPQHMTMQPDEQVTWDVRVTNTGSIADTFDLTPGGLIGPHSSLSRDSVALDANASTIVQLALDQLPSALPGDHALAMMAQSQSAPDIAGHDTALLNLGGRPDAAITISPAVQTLSQTVAISYLVTITNTGNIDMIYHLTPDIAVDGLLLTLETDAVFIPARMSASLLIRVEQEGVPPAGQHPFTITAIGSSATATGTAWIIIPETRDTLPPDTIIISGPASLSDSSAATFVFTGTDDLSLPADLTFACSIDGGVWEPCTSPYIYANLAEGEHTIAIRAIDLSGNVDPTPAIFTWIIDFDTPTTGDDDDDTPTPGDDDDDTPAPGDDDDDMPAPGDDDNDTPAPGDDDDDTPAPGDDDDDTPDQPAQSPRSIYLPLIAKAGSPDLVGQFTLDSDLNALQADHPVVVSVVVTNTGTAPTQAGFWVDLYINPTVPPDQTNLPWHELCQLDACIGVAWYVPYVLDVGERITLTTEHYAEEWSSWNGQLPGGTVDLYLYVDTWNANAETGEWQVGGAVPEGREDNNGFQLPGLLVGAPAEQTPAQLSGLDNPHNWSTRPALLPE
jgi:hypothetical protein